MLFRFEIVYKRDPSCYVSGRLLTVLLEYKDQGVKKGYYKTAFHGVVGIAASHRTYDIHVTIGSSHRHSWYNERLGMNSNGGQCITIEYDDQTNTCTLQNNT